MNYIDLDTVTKEELKFVYTEKNYKKKLYKYPELQEKVRLISKQVASDFLKFLDKEYGLGLFLYAGSGWDKVPKETLGLERVIHLSLEETKGNDLVKDHLPKDVAKYGYFGRLGEGIKVQGDFRECPFKDRVFGSCYIHYVWYDAVTEAKQDITRVLKENGLVIIAKSSHKKYSSKSIYKEYKNALTPIKVKHRFADKFYVLKK